MLRAHLIKTFTNTERCLWLKPRTLKSRPSPSINGAGSPVGRSTHTVIKQMFKIEKILEAILTLAKYQALPKST